jgi:hypothetical protein
MNQVFQKIFTDLSFIRLLYVVMNTSAVRCFKMSAVRVSEISAALSAVSVNFRFSSPASNRTVFVLILSPVLGLANALLGGSNVVLGCGG